MERLKGLFVKKREEEFEIPKDVETRVTEEPKEGKLAAARRLLIKKPPPRFITPYEEAKYRVGVRPPALRLFSADPYATMRACTADLGRTELTLLPNVPYPIIWEPVENWRPPMLSESERQIEFQIPLGQTYARLGVRKSVVTEAWAVIPIVEMPWGLSRMGIIGREQFDLDVISGDFDTRTRLAQQSSQMDRLLKMKYERAFRGVVESTRGMPETEKTYTYDALLRTLGLGSTKELLESDDPEGQLTRAIEVLTEEKRKYRRSKR